MEFHRPRGFGLSWHGGRRRPVLLPMLLLTLIPVAYLKESTDALISYLLLSTRSAAGMQVLDADLSSSQGRIPTVAEVGDIHF